jgi:hypothetical protein
LLKYVHKLLNHSSKIVLKKCLKDISQTGIVFFHLNSKGKSRTQASDFRSPHVVNWGGKLGDGELATPIGGWNFDEDLVLFFEARGHYYFSQNN